MSTVVILPWANAEIIDVLEFTREQFGEAKYLEYRELISLALTTLGTTPTAGKRRPEIHADAWTCHIARPGRKARHCSSIVSEKSLKLPASSTTRWTYRANGSGNGNDHGFNRADRSRAPPRIVELISLAAWGRELEFDEVARAPCPPAAPSLMQRRPPPPPRRRALAARDRMLAA